MMTQIKSIQEKVISATETRVAAFSVPPLRRALVIGLFASLIALMLAYCGLMLATVIAATDRQALERSLPTQRAIVGESEATLLVRTSRIDRTLATTLGFTEAPTTYVVRASLEKGLSVVHAF